MWNTRGNVVSTSQNKNYLGTDNHLLIHQQDLPGCKMQHIVQTKQDIVEQDETLDTVTTGAHQQPLPMKFNFLSEGNLW